MTLSDEELTKNLRQAILAELTITQPPFELTVETEAGTIFVILRDESRGVDVAGFPALVWSVDLGVVGDGQITEKAHEAAEELRKHLQPPTQA